MEWRMVAQTTALKVGTLAKRTGISVRTLHRYDDIAAHRVGPSALQGRSCRPPAADSVVAGAGALISTRREHFSFVTTGGPPMEAGVAPDRGAVGHQRPAALG